MGLSAMGSGGGAGLAAGIPVDPDAPDARELLLRELAKAEYQTAKPTLFDQLADAFIDWLNSLSAPAGPGLPPVGLLVILVIVAAVVGIAFAVYGVPRLNRRSTVTGALFGEDDDRGADDIRRAAEAAARAGDWPLAIAERFRAIARALAERTVVTVSPGTTAHDFSRRAGVAFPASADALLAAAGSFDSVRYLDGPGSSEEWERLSALDRELQAARPRLADDTVPATAGYGMPR